MSPARSTILLLLAWLWPAIASAHGLHPGVLALVEQEPGTFTIAWTEPVDTSGPATSVEPSFPAPCLRRGDRLVCGPEGLRGAVEIRGLGEGHDRVMALVTFLDGRTVEAMITADDPRLVLDGGPGPSIGAWLRVGIEHILFGLDHVAFVLGLLLVVGTREPRRLVATITAFTVAHSITLALAVTGVLMLASAPTEAAIAASVVLVAREATHDRPTLTRRIPWAVAFAFGLVHGLGFAGALTSWGLPRDHLGSTLLVFNVGVELGQLAIVAAAVLVVRGLARALGPRSSALRPVAAYAIGGLAAWWLLERVLAIVVRP